MRADVAFTFESDTAVLGLSGWFCSPIGPIPALSTLPERSLHGLMPGHVLRSAAIRLSASSFCLRTPHQAMGGRSQRCHACDADQWILLEIRAGNPRVTDTTRERFIPQTLNLDLINAVSFNKGCYPGKKL
ncbi:MAG: hypothetical protein CM1200mP41_17750 [Gammaproteobacteria bacterium]|nr:MAG: hypothetical protein CM1200mP41_17750 [Gammaproteobacteria bacterium]